MQKFYLGMDIGTNSVGMACTDENYNLLRAKRKDLWVVRLFDEANTAEERRTKRTARRRIARRKQRVEFLQGIFAPFMPDNLFFIRLNNSGFFEEDKNPTLKSRFSLFNDDGYTDVDFYKEYPTIFHLREALVYGKSADLRHYYLALHHVIKYRGHFLIEGEKVSDVRDLQKIICAYNQKAEDIECESDLTLPLDITDKLKEIATSKSGLTREKDDDHSQKLSRKQRLLRLYDGLAKDCDNVNELMRQLNREEVTDSALRQERLYLYFSQLGRCAYTGEIISLDALSTDLYDVDHIMPRSKYKNDSLENKVLVKREKNKEKSDVYPLPAGFTNQKPFWLMLKNKGLMSEKKYALLTRTKPLDGDDFKEFINRQLVVTNQTVKAVAELLKRKFERFGTKIVYSKASNTDKFKQFLHFVKCRDANDLHHARDAYLNVVAGNIYDVKFSSARDYYLKYGDDSWKQIDDEKLFYFGVRGAWNGASDKARVLAIAQRSSMCVTRYSYVSGGEFYNETVYGKGKAASITAPRKECFPYNKTDRYGGFKSLSTAYFTVVLSKDKKGNDIKTIEAIPVLVDYKSKRDENAVMDYLLKIGLKQPKLLVKKIKLKSLVKINGYTAWIAGITGKQIIIHNARQWFTDRETDLYIKSIKKVVDDGRAGKLSQEVMQSDEIALIKSSKGVSLLANKTLNGKIYKQIIDSLQKPACTGLSGVRSFAAKLQEKSEIFEGLTTYEQITVLIQIMRFMKCNAESADLTLLKDGARCGVLLIGKNITNVDFAIVHQSPCGLTERVQKV